MIKPSGTDAKEIALYFLESASIQVTPANIKKTIIQAKQLLRRGHSKDEIINVIDHVMNKGMRIYSLGYINVSIDDLLIEMSDEIKYEELYEELSEKYSGVNEKLEELQRQHREEVSCTSESSERNKNRADRFGIKSRIGKKSNFDLFER